MDLVQMLTAVQTGTNEQRSQAEQFMKQAEEAQTAPFMAALVAELGREEQTNIAIRQAAGLYFKNMLHAEDDGIREFREQRWMTQIDEATKTQVRTGLLQCLLSPQQGVRDTAAQGIGAAAAIDLPNKQWIGETGVVAQILQCVTAPEGSVPETAKQAALKACGFMCEELEEEHLDETQRNQILTAIVDGIKAGRPDPTRLAAVTALINSLDFCGKNFESENERNMLMTVVCEATQSADVQVREEAYRCVATVVQLHYKHLAQSYMDALYPMTVQTITTDNEAVAKQAVEFWSTLCEVELDLEEMEEPSFEYMKKAMPHLIGTLLATLEKQDEDGDGDEWDLAKQASWCMSLISRTVKDPVVDHVMPYITQNVQQADWRKRDAAIMAFGNVLDGPQDAAKMAGIVGQAMQLLVGSLVDPSIHVKDTTAWTLSEIARLHATAIPFNQLMPLLTNLMTALDDEPRVASKVCYVLHQLAEQKNQIGGGQPWLTANIMGPVMQKVIKVVEREDGEEHNMRAGAYEALNMLIEAHGEDCRGLVMELSTWVLTKLTQSLQANTLTDEDRQNNQELQGLLTATMNYIVKSVTAEEVKQFGDTLMQCLLQVLTQKGSSVASEEVFLCVGMFAGKLEDYFERYLPHFMPLLVNGLKSSAEYQVCSSAVGAAGDICRAVEVKVAPYCDEIVMCLLQALEDPALNRSVKPGMLTLFGDIALAVGGEFQRYLAPPSKTMMMLYQASKTQVPMDDEDMVEYLNELHTGILEAFTGIVNGLEGNTENPATNVVGVLMQVEVSPGVNAVQGIAEFLQKIAGGVAKERGGDESAESEVVLTAVGIIGDLGRTLGKPAAPFLPQQIVTPLLQECMIIAQEDEDESAASVARYSQEQLNKVHAI